MKIRPEEIGDEQALFDLTTAAFEPMSFSDGSEAEALNTLRNDGDLVLSLVAVDGDEIVGHLAISPAVIGGDREGWFGIGPISVTPGRQRTGIGSALMQEGISRLKLQGAKGCVLTGNPAYYNRFGFVGDGSITYQNKPAKNVQWLAFSDDAPKGEIRFSAGLE